MWPISSSYYDALRAGHALSLRMEITKVDPAFAETMIIDDVPVLGGSITCDRAAVTRRTLTCTIPMYDELLNYVDVVNTVNTRVRLYSGVDFHHRQELVPIGAFRVNEKDTSMSGELSLSGSSFECYVDDARFIKPYTPTKGIGALDAIVFLIREAFPNATVHVRATNNYVIRSQSPYERERWQAIDDLATSAGAEVYTRPDGAFVIADVPNITRDAAVWDLDEGENGVLIQRSESENRDGVYNAVVAMGQSSDPDIPPVSDVAYDLDPLSPFFWEGGFGKVPRFYSSQFLYTKAQCKTTADMLLSRTYGTQKTLKIEGVPNAALDAGDIITVGSRAGTIDKHILQSFSLPLGPGTWSAETRKVAVDDDESGDE